MKNKKSTPDSPVNGDSVAVPKVNRHARRAMQRTNRKTRTTRLVDEKPGTVVYHDDSYIDKTKKAVTHGMQYVRDRLKAKNQHFDLPERIQTVRRPLRTRCLIINRDGRERAFLPDVRPQHKILVHGSVARTIVSKVCMLVRITANRSKDDDSYIDGSWAVTPAEYRMMNATTIQYLRRRPWFLFRRYWYEISFDGRVQPAHLLFDYELNPVAKKTRLWITREYVPVADSDRLNDYFRFWRSKPPRSPIPTSPNHPNIPNTPTL